MESLLRSEVLVTLGLGGTVMMFAKSIISSLWGVFIKHISTTLTENNENPVMMQSISDWITKHNIAKRIKSYRLKSTTIAPGGYWVKIDWLTICYIEYKVEKRDGWSSMYEIYTLTFFGLNQKKYLDELFTYRDALIGNNTINIYKANHMYMYTKHAKRSFDSVFTDNNLITEIKQQLDTWRRNEQLYADKGIVYKIGFCFYGPPGTGKTTLAKAIASYMNMDLRSVKLDKDTNDFYRSSTGNSVYLFDDVDEYIAGLNKENAPSSYDQLLSFIDGTDSPCNSIFIFATNNYDTLPPAMLRTGRIDHKYYLGPIGRDTATRMCKNYGLDSAATYSLLKDHTHFLPCDLQLSLLAHLNGVA